MNVNAVLNASLISIDIETLGRLEEKPLPDITCICTYDGKNKTAFRFWQMNQETRDSNKKALCDILNEADYITGYNLVYFDFVYMKQVLNIDEKVVSDWILKTVDVFMVCKHILKHTCKLDHILSMNQLSQKCGDGRGAIELARLFKFQELIDYCMNDAVLCYELLSLSQGIVISEGAKLYIQRNESEKIQIELKARFQQQKQMKPLSWTLLAEETLFLDKCMENMQ